MMTEPIVQIDNEKRRPHICWDKIYSQLNTHCQVVFDDTFENIFTF